MKTSSHRFAFFVLLLLNFSICAAGESYIERMGLRDDRDAGIRTIAVVHDSKCEYPIELYNPENAVDKFAENGLGIAIAKLGDLAGLGTGSSAEWDQLIFLIKEIDWITPELENMMGEATYVKMQEAGDILQDKGLDHALYVRLENLLGPIVSSIPDDILPYDIKAYIVKGENSFSIPGGYIFISKSDFGLNDGALSFIIAHELSHVTKRHAVRMYQARIGELISIPVLRKYLLGNDPADMIGLVTGLKKYDADYNVE